MIKDQNVKKNLVKPELKKSLLSEKAKFDEAYERFNKLILGPKKKKNKPYFEFFLVEYDPSIYNFDQKFLENCCNKTFYTILEILEYDQKFHLPHEREFLQQTFYSLGISMENNLNADFFKIKIKNISIKQTNKYSKLNSKKTKSNYLEIISFYPIKIPQRKREIIW